MEYNSIFEWHHSNRFLWMRTLFWYISFLLCNLNGFLRWDSRIMSILWEKINLKILFEHQRFICAAAKSQRTMWTAREKYWEQKSSQCIPRSFRAYFDAVVLDFSMCAGPLNWRNYRRKIQEQGDDDDTMEKNEIRSCDDFFSLVFSKCFFVFIAWKV